MPTSFAAAEANYLDQGLKDLDWQDHAACKGADLEAFFTHGKPNPAALALCESCPVVESCREYAVDRPWIAGIWGGTTSKERDRLRVRRDEAPRECARGHLLDEENTYVRPDGARTCRACARTRRRRADARKQEAPKPTRAPVTHCQQRHEFTDANTYINPSSGARLCRACKRGRDRAYRNHRRTA